MANANEEGTLPTAQMSTEDLEKDIEYCELMRFGAAAADKDSWNYRIYENRCELNRR